MGTHLKNERKKSVAEHHSLLIQPTVSVRFLEKKSSHIKKKNAELNNCQTKNI